MSANTRALTKGESNLTASESYTDHQGRSDPTPVTPYRLERPAVKDAAQIHDLIACCKPLDVNSTYAYLLLCLHFRDTCVVARSSAGIAGFVSAYIPPQSPDTIFVWQVAVHPDAQGAGLGKRMLRELLGRESLSAVSYLETTVSPTNAPSRRMFLSVSRALSCACREQLLFDEVAFGGEQHEAEVLLKLGPFESLNRKRRSA